MQVWFFFFLLFQNLYSGCFSSVTGCYIYVSDDTFFLNNDLISVIVCLHQGEEGPPSLEYIKAKDLFPQKELVKEDECLQVS